MDPAAQLWAGLRKAHSTRVCSSQAGSEENAGRDKDVDSVGGVWTLYVGCELCGWGVDSVGGVSVSTSWSGTSQGLHICKASYDAS